MIREYLRRRFVRFLEGNLLRDLVMSLNKLVVIGDETAGLAVDEELPAGVAGGGAGRFE